LPPTIWRANSQQARYTTRYSGHSLPGELRSVVVSRLETLQGTETTHSLENQRKKPSAALKYSKVIATTHRLDGQEEGVVSRLKMQQEDRNYSLTEVSKTDIVSKFKTEK
jgi:hypothetical protein